MIQIHPEMCVGCGLCASDCFPGALTFSVGKPQLSAPENCIGCGHCIAICPKGAIDDPALPGDDIVPAGAQVPAQTLLAQMRGRRSCRHYGPEPVTQEELATILNAARACPTAKNLQSTRYIVVRDKIPELLDAALHALGELGARQLQTAQDPGEQRRAKNFLRWSQTRQRDRTFDPLFFHAPLLLLFVAPAETAPDAAAGAAYAELMAASLGLGCLYSGYFTACAGAEPAIGKMLGLKPGERLVRCLVLGHPAVRYARTAPRKPPEVTEL